MEVFAMKEIITTKTINILREAFARFGKFVTIATDNGRQFISEEFKTFLKSNGIIHKLLATYHPATNGQVERYIQTIKRSLKAMADEPGSINLKLSRMLIQLRKILYITSKRSPADLLLKSSLRTKLDLIKPNTSIEVRNKQEENLGRRGNTVYEPNETVLIRNYRGHEKWLIGKIIKQIGDLHYLADVGK